MDCSKYQKRGLDAIRNVLPDYWVTGNALGICICGCRCILESSQNSGCTYVVLEASKTAGAKGDIP